MKSEMQYTPGPWFVENLMSGGPRIVHGKPDADGFRDDVVFRQPTIRAQANARLIAAAPEQNEMLTKVLAGFIPDPGTSDLDDEQPINVSMTLGDYRRIQRLMWKVKGR